MKRILCFAIFFAALNSSAGVWDATTPTGNAPISQGDDRIREMKEALEEALEHSGVFPGTNPLTTPMYQWTYGYGLSSARPTSNLQDGQIYYSTDTATAEMYMTSGSTWTVVSWGQLAPYLPNTFRVVGSSVGIGDTTPDAMLDVAGTLKVDGVTSLDGGVVSDGNITTTGDDVDISTHASISGNLSVSGTFQPTTLTVTSTVTFSGMTFVSAEKTSSQSVLSGNVDIITFPVENIDRLNEWNGSSFTATMSGDYFFIFTIPFDTDSSDLVGLRVYINGTLVDSTALEGVTTFLQSITFSYSSSLTSGDIVNFRSTGGASGNTTWSQGGADGFLTITRIP